MKLLSIVIMAAGVIAILIGVIDFGNTLKLFFSGERPAKLFKGINKNVGTIAEITGITAGVLWLLRKVWVEIKKRKLPFSDWIQQFYLVVKKHHIFIGVITLIAAFAHGLYFYLYAGKDDDWLVYSGIATFISLIILALLGWNHQLNKRTKKNVSTKKRHIFLAIVFGILFLIHLNL